MFLLNFKKHVFYVFYLQVNVFNIYEVCYRGLVMGTSYQLQLTSLRQFYKHFYSNNRINCTLLAAWSNWSTTVVMEADNVIVHTENGVKRVLIKHHQLTLQYLTDEVLQLKDTK